MLFFVLDPKPLSLVPFVLCSSCCSLCPNKRMQHEFTSIVQKLIRRSLDLYWKITFLNCLEMIHVRDKCRDPPVKRVLCLHEVGLGIVYFLN